MTQADVAALAGVSQATVSIVLNGRTPAGVRIGPKTAQRVLDAIRITGYSADPVARRLAGGRNQILGVFSYESTFPQPGGADFYSPFLTGIEHAAEELGVDILLFTSARVEDGRRRLTRGGWQRLGVADGCLLLGQHEDRFELQQLLDTTYPFVFVGRRDAADGKLPYVGVDYANAVAQAVERLVRLGHTRIAYLGPAGTDQPTAERIMGYRRAMAEHALEARCLATHAPQEAAAFLAGQGLTGALLAPEVDPQGLLAELLAREIRVPADLSVLLLGQPHRAPGPTAWSGFTIPRERVGARALQLLSQLVEGTGGASELHQLLPCEEVEGRTAGPR